MSDCVISYEHCISMHDVLEYWCKFLRANEYVYVSHHSTRLPYAFDNSQIMSRIITKVIRSDNSSMLCVKVEFACFNVT